MGLQALALLEADCGTWSSSDRPPGLPPVAFIEGPWGWPVAVLLILAGLTVGGLIVAIPLHTTKNIRRMAAASSSGGTQTSSIHAHYTSMRWALATVRMLSVTVTVSTLALQGLSFAAARLLSAPSNDEPTNVGAACIDALTVALTIIAAPIALITCTREREFKQRHS